MKNVNFHTTKYNCDHKMNYKHKKGDSLKHVEWQDRYCKENIYYLI